MEGRSSAGLIVAASRISSRCSLGSFRSDSLRFFSVERLSNTDRLQLLRCFAGQGRVPVSKQKREREPEEWVERKRSEGRWVDGRKDTMTELPALARIAFSSCSTRTHL